MNLVDYSQKLVFQVFFLIHLPKMDISDWVPM